MDCRAVENIVDENVQAQVGIRESLAKRVSETQRPAAMGSSRTTRRRTYRKPELQSAEDSGVNIPLSLRFDSPRIVK